MAKTADLQQSVWTDPWFLNLTTDSKCLYLWAVTTQHGNLAGLFTVAAPVIQLETGLTPARFDAALEALEGKLDYFPESGAMWIRGKAKYTRSKTTQIARSIAKAVEACPEPVLQQAFLEKYGASAWLQANLEDLALQADNPEPHQNLGEVPISRSISRSISKEEQRGSRTRKAPDKDALPADYPAELVPAVDQVLPVLQRVADAKGAKAVSRRPVANAIAGAPDRNHAAAAGDLEHWALYGNGERRAVKDVVATYRHFLKNADRMPVRAVPRPDYDAHAMEVVL